MFQIKFSNGFSADEQDETRAACAQVESMSKQLVQGIGTERFLRLAKRWFGSTPVNAVVERVKKMDAVIRDASRAVTFVYREGGVLNAVYGGIDVPPATVDPLDPTKLNVGGISVKSQKPIDTGLQPVFAFVFPAQGGGTASTSHHVGSGMRLYLATQYFALPTGDEGRAHTIYHELTHKTLGTEDYAYEDQPCTDLAQNEPNKAIRNADNWAWFAITYAKLSATVVIA